MTLRHLEIFRAVCTHESVTQAAEKLNMTQPAVSMAIKELEVLLWCAAIRADEPPTLHH